MAPEVVKQEGYSYAADIWSLGCLAVEMLTGKPTWYEYGKDPRKILNIIKNSTSPPKLPDNISNEALSFLEVCLRMDPATRPTSSMLLEHPFISERQTKSRLPPRSKITI